MPAGRRPRWVLAAVALCALAAWCFATQTITSPRRLSAPSLEAQVTRTFVKRRSTTTSDLVVLHTMTYDSPSGATTIRWYDNDFEPTRARASAVVSRLIDGARVASTIKNSFAGIYDDEQGGSCLVWKPKSRATPDRRPATARQPIMGLPYTDPSRVGVDEPIVRSDHTHAS
jgi:hypothetical protein